MPHPAAARWLRRLVGGVLGAVAVAAVATGVALSVTDDDPAPFVEALDAPGGPLGLGETSVLLLSHCTVRASHLGFHGYADPTTPLLDALADRSVVFDAHLAQAPWTKPSMGALFSGRWPRELRVDDPVGHNRMRQILPDDITLLAERMRGFGYATIGSVANPNLNRQFAYDQGFDAYVQHERTPETRHDYPSAAEVADGALARLADVPDGQPVYIRASMFDGHEPIQFAPLDLLRMSDGEPRVRAYDAGLRSIDRHSARLIEAVRAARPNLLVVLAADHGEALRRPAHHGRGHGNFVYQTHLRTPWLLHHPDLAPRRVGELSMNIDVVPTVLDLLGAPVPSDVDGASQAAAARGDVHEPVHDRVFAESFYRVQHKSTVVTSTHQLIRDYDRQGEGSPYTDTLFAVEDWRAEHPLDQTEPEVHAALAAALTDWEAAQDLALSGERPAEVVAPDPELTESLRALGYVE